MTETPGSTPMPADEPVALDLSVMADLPLEPRPCPMADALQILGERWSLLAVREMSYGVHRFEKIAGFTGASRDILADRLRKLEAAGVVERRQYSEHPPRFEYHLTEAGNELRPIMLSLGQWGARWAPNRSTGPRTPRFVHDCGHPIRIDHVCHYCREPIGDDSTRVRLERS